MKFSMNIADDIHTTIKMKCVQSGITMTEYIMGCVNKDLESNTPINDREARFKAAMDKTFTENRDAIRRLADK